MFYSNVNKIFLGTDGAASSRVGQILPLRVEGSIPYSAPLRSFYKLRKKYCHTIEDIISATHWREKVLAGVSSIR